MFFQARLRVYREVKGVLWGLENICVVLLQVSLIYYSVYYYILILVNVNLDLSMFNINISYILAVIIISPKL